MIDLRPGDTIYLVNPPSTSSVYKEDRCQNDANELVANFPRPPINLLYLAGIAERLGYVPVVIDCPGQRIGFKSFIKRLNHEKPVLAVVNTALQTFHDDRIILRYLKFKGITTAIIGYHASINRDELIKDPCIDLIMTHEPEAPFNDLLSKKQLNTIKGLAYKELSGTIHVNEQQPFIENLDLLPFPAHHLLDLKKYINPLTGKPFLTIQASRGCPYGCKFCLAEYMNGKRLRLRTVQNIIDEIRQVKASLGIASFFFRADTFTANKKWVLEFCNEIIRMGLQIEWYTNARIDTLDIRLVKRMAMAGCKLLSIGVETGDSKSQILLGKHLDLINVKKILTLLKSNGIMSVIYFLIGIPRDNEQRIIHGINFSLSLDATFVEYVPYIDFDGTSLHGQPAMQSSNKHREKKWIEYGKRRFYVRPKKMLEMSMIIGRNVVKSPRMVFYLIKNIFVFGSRVLR